MQYNKEFLFTLFHEHQMQVMLHWWYQCFFFAYIFQDLQISCALFETASVVVQVISHCSPVYCVTACPEMMQSISCCSTVPVASLCFFISFTNIKPPNFHSFSATVSLPFAAFAPSRIKAKFTIPSITELRSRRLEKKM